MIYLDNAATTFPKSEAVYAEMDYVNRNIAVNAERGSYKLARKATTIIDQTRKKILDLVNGQGVESVILTSSVTLALNQILMGIKFQNGDTIYLSPYEHNAVARTLHLIKKNKNIHIKELPINDKTFQVDLEKMRYQFSKQTPACVCCIHISNVTGYILPVNEIFKLAKEYKAITILDAAQSMGLLDIDIKNLKADFIAFAGHKTLYGPFGIAGFIDASQIKLNEVLAGGTGSNSLDLNMPIKSPEKYEFASKNIIAIAGLNKALDEIDIQNVFSYEKKLTGYLIEQLKQITGIIMYLPKDLEKSHISIVSFNIEGYKAEDVGMILDQDYDIAVRTGYHCVPFLHKYLKDELYLGTVRIGLGKFNTKEDIDGIINAIKELLYNW